LAKLDLRRAIAKGINREEIIRFKLDGLATLATSLLSPVTAYHDASLTPIAFDREQARLLVEKLGLKGTRFTLKTSSVPSAVENGRVIANQLSAIGLTTVLQSYEWGTFYGDIQKGNFEMATMRWVGLIDPDLYRSALHSKEKPPIGRNRGHYANPALDSLLEQGLRIESEPARIRHYAQVQKTVLNDLPLIPLWYDKEVAVVATRIKGYVPPLNGDYTPLTQVEKTR
jgi:peptide/nickel transport system substrate-binding protein